MASGPNRHVEKHYSELGEPLWVAGRVLGPNHDGTGRSIFHTVKIYFLTGTRGYSYVVGTCTLR